MEIERDERNAFRDERQPSVTGGTSRVTNGIRATGLALAFLTIAAFLLIVDTFNIFTTIHDAAERGMTLAAWEPATWEYTSGVATLASCAIIYAAMRIAPPGRVGWPKFIAAHAVASLAFSSLHILLMNTMRVAIYAAVGHHYPFGESGFLYEYRKDVIAYIVIAGIFWLFTRARHMTRPLISPNERRFVDIRDGKRLLRVPIEEIAAIRAAGNYVEFVLTDGRRPLARKSLAEAYRELGEGHFVRTHRSWAVNASHVRELRSLGTGDYQVELVGGIEAPLSRRFPDALASLRGAEHRQ